MPIKKGKSRPAKENNKLYVDEFGRSIDSKKRIVFRLGQEFKLDPKETARLQNSELTVFLKSVSVDIVQGDLGVDEEPNLVLLVGNGKEKKEAKLYLRDKLKWKGYAITPLDINEMGGFSTFRVQKAK